MFEVKRDTLISDIIMNAPDTMPLFQSIGMHCMGCVMASGENIEEACDAHGVDVDDFLKKLNAYIAELG
jgi:hybrid cluster-associated redox disulfide protein